MQIEYDYSSTIIDCLDYVESFDVFENGKILKIEKDIPAFRTLLLKLENLFYSSRIMPAFGVSLHNETLNALKKDSWLQLNFSKELCKNGLNFSSLLIKLEETSGINLIRLNNGKYDGRSIFLDLENVMDLQDLLN